MNSEVHLANGKRGRNSLRPPRGGGCCLPLRRKREKLRRKTGGREREARGREGGRERDKGNTGLASTQFPSLASNFRRILPSHSILPLYQRVSLHLPQLSRPSSPFLNRYLHPRLSLSSRSRRIPCIPLVSQLVSFYLRQRVPPNLETRD